jgi:hypothetical protein
MNAHRFLWLASLVSGVRCDVEVDQVSQFGAHEAVACRDAEAGRRNTSLETKMLCSEDSLVSISM